MAARLKAESSEGLYLACIAADNGKSHSHNDTGSFWVYSEGLPVLMDMGQETYQKKSFDAHRYDHLAASVKTEGCPRSRF